MEAIATWWWLFFCFTSFVAAAEAYEAVCNVLTKNKFNVQRRTFLELETAWFAGLVTANINDAQALDVGPNTNRDASTGNFNCLLDLPPITPGCARLYLCRHGQTENNRLRLIYYI